MKARSLLGIKFPLFPLTFVMLASMMLAGCATPPLFRAAGSGNIKEVETLLNNGVDVNEKGGGGLLNDSNALAAASSEGHLAIVKLLLDRGANVNAVDGNMGWTPLSSAAWRGHTDVAQLLIERGADTNKAIVGLNQGVGTGHAIELIKQIKQDRVAGQVVVAKASTEISYSPSELKSDVDELPAIKSKPNKYSYAIVIGIEQYRQKLPKADFAAQDAKLVAEYLTKMLGYHDENVVLLTNERALQSDFTKYFEKWLPNNVEPNSTVFIYYSGHGAPNPKTGDAYLVPYDGDPTFIEETGFSLKRMYAALGKLPAKEVIVALDSCFSGAGGRSVLAKGARPIVLSVENPVLASKNITVLSASAGDQTSSTYDEKGHGLFTYFMLKGIKNEDVVKKDGSLDVSSLYDYVKPQVSSIARKKYNNEQTPQLIGAKNK